MSKIANSRIGVARIFASGMHYFWPQILTTILVVGVLTIQKLCKIPHAAPKLNKIVSSRGVGVHSCPLGGCTYNYPLN